jgi:hypothetical protein
VFDGWSQEIAETPVHRRWRRAGRRRWRGRSRDAEGRIAGIRRVAAGDGRARHDGELGRRTGRVEPITKVEIKSKANGIIKALNADVDRTVKEGDILVELDRELLAATLRGAEANLQAARASLEGADAQLKKHVVEAEGNGTRVQILDGLKQGDKVILPS